MSLTNAAEQAALEAVLTGTYVALFTSPPGENGTGGTEVTGTGYARQSWTPAYTQGSPTEAANSATISFTAGSSWGEVTHAVIMSASTAGVAHAVLELVDPADGVTPLPKNISSGDDVQFATGELVITLE